MQDKKPDTTVLNDNNLVIVTTPEYVKDSIKEAIEEHAASRNHPDATLQDKGFVILSNDVGSDSETMAATPKAVKAVKAAYDLANNANDNANLALPVGVPVPWPTENPPEGWLICNGDLFDTAKYPKLALAYPSGILPDLRGEFIRGWDTEGIIDPGRTLLSPQTDAIQNIVGTFGRTQLFQDYVASGPFQQSNSLLSNGLHPSPTQDSGYGASEWTFDASRAVRTAMETRPRNIAFNYIVRAA
ncbi:phage tail protein [Xenorhabdus bovienii]|uniref:Putative E14 prophage tail fiber protein (Modular protein) n=1 Tax=Xenorhabdus bovienii str. kraussei Becker Underwood TaxID=1398204 RepID=A0A077PUI1_XENBV|nr:phage tail protein [Xenorhabdus bovienii]CDH24421.1 putative E14 prophage; tail fiber protein (Modular protein) [Xenorhabdus bovienii str. kraussei Becker Underwood]